MDKKTQIIKPKYYKIYKDIVDKKFPKKKEIIYPLLKKYLTALEITTINNILFNNSAQTTDNQKYKSYNQDDIKVILQFQKNNNLTNIAIAKEFNISRNTISAWKKNF